MKPDRSDARLPAIRRHEAGAVVAMRRHTSASLLQGALLLAFAGASGFGASPATAGALDAFSNADASAALKQALDKGAAAAVSRLGAPGGFLDNPKVRIPLPEGLRQAEQLLRLAGKGDELDALVATMNRAAEAAVPEARQMLAAAIKSMSVQDAKGILTGGEESVTHFFAEKTRGGLTTKFLPVVSKQVGRLGLAKRYNDLAGQGVKLGLLKEESASIERYVTGKSLDGLYAMIAEQERAIRSDPVKAGGELLGKVFGALR
jgi:hypothetical protein